MDKASPAPSREQSAGQGLGQQHGDLLVVVTPADGFAHLTNRCGFVLAGFLTCNTYQKLMFLDQGVDFRHRAGGGKTRHVAHGRAHQDRKICLVHGFQGTPGERRKDEVMIVQGILGDGHA